MSVRDSNGALFSSTSFNVSTETVTINPWGLDKRLLVGTYVIDIRGALGRGASFKVNLAEGLTATSNTDFRWFTARGGLERAEVTVSIGGFKQVASLAEKDASRALSINLGEATLSAIVEIDHLSVSVESSNGSSAPSIGPVTIDIENLPTSILHIHAVRGQYACVNLIASRDVHQRIDVVANSAGTIKIPLAGFADTARSLGSSELFFVMDGRSCRVAQIQPRKLLNGVNLISDTVTVDKTSENLDIELILRVDYAPWNVPAQVRLSPGTSSVELPERLLSRGPLSVIARTYDPWNRDSIGHLEEVWSGNYFKLDQSINPKLSSLEDEFVRWIGGTATCPSSFEALEFAIDNYGSFAHVRSVAHSSYLLRDVAEMTLTHGSRVLDVARESRWSRKTHTRLLAEGWPATAASGDEPTNPSTWRVSPFLGLLESLERKHDPYLDDLVSSSLGEAALCILNEGIDPWPKAGYLGDRNIARLADRPRVEAESLWRRIAAIPGPLLTEDQRIIHAKSLFDRRDSIDLQGLINGTRQVVQETTELLQTKFDDHALYPLRARHAPDNWQSLPMASLALALTARLAARGSKDAADSYHFRRPWFATLADHAPEFVEQDLILAELWLHRWENE